jgi:hypothetical protein
MKALAFALILICMVSACATTTVLHGDKDGFGLGVKADEQFDHTIIDSRIAAGDGDGTDVYFNIPGGTDHYTWSFSYAPLSKPIKSATLEIFHGGVCHGSELFLDNHFIGKLTNGEGPRRVGTWARVDTFYLPASVFHLLDGDNTLKVKTIWGGNLAVDYILIRITH